MNRPAITNQYGEMYTGMPNGRAITIPGCGLRCALRCGAGGSGIIPATLTMLREKPVSPGVRRGPGTAESGKAARLSGAYPTLPLVSSPQTAPEHPSSPGPAAGGGWRRPAGTGDLAVAGRRLHDLPA